MEATSDPVLSLRDEFNESCPWNISTQNPYRLPWYLEATYGIFFATMVLVSAGGNSIVAWIVLGHERMRTVTNYFLVNLAVSDGLITIFNTMFNFIYMTRSHWPFGFLYCKFITFLVPCTISTSVFTFIAIAVERYLAIVHPLRPRLSSKKVLMMILIIWISSILISLPCLLYARTHTHGCQFGRVVCYVQWPGDADLDEQEFRYNVFLLLITYLLPLVVLAFTYARVGFELWTTQAIGETSARLQESVNTKKRIVKMMVIIVVIFGICWLPQNVFLLVQYQHPSITTQSWFQHVALVTYWLAMSNSMYNPIVYCWMNARFRSGFKFALRWMPCVTWRSTDGDDDARFLVFKGLRISTTEHHPMNDLHTSNQHPTSDIHRSKITNKTKVVFFSEFKNPDV